MTIPVNSSFNNIILATKSAVDKKSDMGGNISQKELNNIVSEVQKSGVSAQEAQIVINDTIQKMGSNQKVNLTADKLENPTTFKFSVSGKVQEQGSKTNTESKANSENKNVVRKELGSDSKPKVENKTQSQKSTSTPQTTKKPLVNSETKTTQKEYQAEASFSIPVKENKVEQKETSNQETKTEQKDIVKQEVKNEEKKDNGLKPVVRNVSKETTEHKTLKHHPNQKNIFEKIGDIFDGNNHPKTHHQKTHKKHGHVDVSSCPKF